MVTDRRVEIRVRNYTNAKYTLSGDWFADGTWDPKGEVVNVLFDSRKINNLSLFIAVNGVSQNGHHFISDAESNGACAIICDEIPENLKENITYIKVPNSSESIGVIASNFYDNPSEKLKLIGITGTNGKTTCATLLYDLYRLMGYKTGLISTVNIKILN